MNADQARKLAQTNKERKEEHERIRKQDAYLSDRTLLLKHIHEKIEEAVKGGQFNTSTIKFAQDRFPEPVISEVAHSLKKEGYSLVIDRQNAYQTIVFSLSWSS